MEDTKLSATLNGNNVDINVLEIIDDTETGKQYVVYNADGYDDDFFISILEENEDNVILKEITDDNEFKMVEDYLAALMEKEAKEND